MSEIKHKMICSLTRKYDVEKSCLNGPSKSSGTAATLCDNNGFGRVMKYPYKPPLASCDGAWGHTNNDKGPDELSGQAWKWNRDYIPPHPSMLVQAHSKCQHSSTLQWSELVVTLSVLSTYWVFLRTWWTPNYEGQNPKDTPRQEVYFSVVQSSSRHPRKLVWPLGESDLDPGFR